MLTRIVQDDIKPVLARYADLPVDWLPGLPHGRLAARLQSADVFVLPSLEDGFARTVAEALACGLPAVVTPNTGARDLIEPGVNGEIVPIRDPASIAEAVLKCWERELNPPAAKLQERLSFQAFETEFLTQLEKIGLGEKPLNSGALSKKVELTC
jgi:glycosyltransferase involved in cell wall biosynthesis